MYESVDESFDDGSRHSSKQDLQSAENFSNDKTCDLPVEFDDLKIVKNNLAGNISSSALERSESVSETELVIDESKIEHPKEVIDDVEPRLLYIERSSSVESGEPLVGTRFMGGRRSWSSVSNYDAKNESLSESNSSRNSWDVYLRTTKDSIKTDTELNIHIKSKDITS